MDMICPENGAGIPEAYDAFYNLCESEPIDHVKSLPYSRLGQDDGALTRSAMENKEIAWSAPWLALPRAGVVAGRTVG
ncbi:MAG TPA: hypothetical protein EYQ66_15035 [Myxococcales bacterium]|nr:hypothetical protein [Myxococcales bacterium]